MPRLIWIFLLFVSAQTYGQIGISGQYSWNDADAWAIPNEGSGSQEANLLGDGWSVSVDYWLRLKNVRIEFFPTLQYSQYNMYPSGQTTTLDNQAIEFLVKTNFYLLNFLDDCDCPTFSKQNSILDRGFFVQLQGGVGRMQQQLEVQDISSTSTYTALGAGLGIDIGISDLVTITPQIGYRWVPSLSIENNELEKNLPEVDTETSISQLQAPVRLGFRLDYKGY